MKSWNHQNSERDARPRMFVYWRRQDATAFLKVKAGTPLLRDDGLPQGEKQDARPQEAFPADGERIVTLCRPA